MDLTDALYDGIGLFVVESATGALAFRYGLLPLAGADAGTVQVSDPCLARLSSSTDPVTELPPDKLDWLYSSFSVPKGDVWALSLPYQLNQQRWLLIVDPRRQFDLQGLGMVHLAIGWRLTTLKLHQQQQRLEKANAWIVQELEDMSRLQQLMLPDPDTHIPGVNVAFTYQALKGAGGDYLDFVSLEDDKSLTSPHQMGIIVADVTGHGPSAAIEAGMLDAILRTFSPPEDLDDPEPSIVLDYINEHFFTRKSRGTFLTVSIMHYEPTLRRLTYANAGHPHAYLKRGSSVVALDKGGIPVGISKGYQWESYQIEVQKGDTVFLYTDVVIETKNPDQEDFGFDRLEDALRSADSDPEIMIGQIEQAMRMFCHCKQFADDLTMCAVQFTE